MSMTGDSSRGPVLSGSRVVFRFGAPAGSRALLLGDFTGWQRAPIELVPTAEPGVLEAAVEGLKPGIYAYKFLLDGAWTHDPANRLHRDDGVGGRNSILIVGEPSPKTCSLRVGSLNLHTYQEREPIARLEDIALAYASYRTDVLLLQEVGEHVSDASRPNAGELLSRMLGSFTGKHWHHTWFEAHRGFDVYREGLSILSIYPLAEINKIQLSDGPLARIAVSASIELDRVPLRLVTTHTSWNDHRHAEHEAGMLLEALAPSRHAEGRGTLVAGDFNGGPSSAQVQRMLKGGFVDVGALLKETRPTLREGMIERIDYQFLSARSSERSVRPVRLWRVLDGSAGFHPRVSDHVGLLGDYQLT